MNTLSQELQHDESVELPLENDDRDEPRWRYGEYSNLAKEHHRRHNAARKLWHAGRRFHCRQACLELLNEPYLPRFTRVETLQLLSVTYEYYKAMPCLVEALKICDEMDIVDSSQLVKKIRKDTEEMIERLEKRKAAVDANIDENGNYIGPPIISEHEGLRREAEEMHRDRAEQHARSVLSDYDESDDDIDDLDPLTVKKQSLQKLVEQVSALCVRVQTHSRQLTLQEQAVRAGWTVANAYRPSPPDFHREGQQIPPGKRYEEMSWSDHDAMTLALLNAAYSNAEGKLPEALSPHILRQREVELTEAINTSLASKTTLDQEELPSLNRSDDDATMGDLDSASDVFKLGG